MPDRYALSEIPYNFEDLKLGSLVPNIAQPDQDVLAPSRRLRQGIDFKVRMQKNFHFLLELDDGSSLKLRLTRLFSASHTTRKEDKAELWSAEGRVYSLAQPKQLFRSFCASTHARKWMQETLDDGQDIYFVVGLRTFIDATDANARGETDGLEASLNLPVGDIVGGSGAGKPLDVNIEALKTSEHKETQSFEIPGERIFAVAYRKVKFDWLFKRDVSTAKLSADNVWVSSFTRGNSEYDERCIEADLEDETSSSPEAVESITLEVDGSTEEIYLCRQAAEN